MHLNNKNKTNYCAIGLCLFIIGIGLLFFPITGTMTTEQTFKDLIEGFRIIHGKSIEDVSRPLVYSLTAIAILFGGVSAISSLYVTRVFFVGNIGLVYLMSSRMYGTAEGIIASLLVLSSFAINYSSSIANPIVTMKPFFIMLFVLTLYHSLDAQKRLAAGFAGILLGLGCLADQLLFIYLLLPITSAFTVLEYRAGQSRVILRILYSAFLIVYLPWVTYSLMFSERHFIFSEMEIGVGLSEYIQNGSTVGLGEYDIISTVLWNFPGFVLKYYSQVLAAKSTIAPLMVISLIFVICRAIYYKKGSDIILSIACLLFLLSSLLESVLYEQSGQEIVFYYLSYISLSSMVIEIARWLVKLLSDHLIQLNKAYVLSLGSGMLVGAQLLGGANSSYALLFQNSYQSLFGKLSFYQNREIVIEKYTLGPIEEAIYWIMNNISPLEPILLDESMAKTFKNLTGEIYMMKEFAKLTNVQEAWGEIANGRIDSSDRILYAMPSPGFFSKDPRKRHVFYFLFERDVLNPIHASEVRYIVLGPERLFLCLYLDTIPWIQLSFMNEEAAIYEINRATISSVADWKLVTADGIESIFPVFRKENPQKFQELKRLLSFFNLTDYDLVTNTYERFQQNWVRGHLPDSAKVIYSSPHGSFILPDWEERVRWFNYDRSLESLLTDFDYLFLNLLRRYYKEFPRLFVDLHTLRPLKVFPYIREFDFGEGWEIYRLPADNKAITPAS